MGLRGVELALSRMRQVYHVRRRGSCVQRQSQSCHLRMMLGLVNLSIHFKTAGGGQTEELSRWSRCKP